MTLLSSAAELLTSRLGRLGEGVRLVLVLVLALTFECSEAAKAPPEVVKLVKPWMALAAAEKFMVKIGSRTVEVNFTSLAVVSSPQPQLSSATATLMIHLPLPADDLPAKCQHEWVMSAFLFIGILIGSWKRRTNANPFQSAAIETDYLLY